VNRGQSKVTYVKIPRELYNEEYEMLDFYLKVSAKRDKREANSLHCIILEGKKSKIASIIRKIMNKIEMVYKFQKNLIVPEDKKENFLLRVSQYFSISLWLCVS
jgi:hypothetical protein